MSNRETALPSDEGSRRLLPVTAPPMKRYLTLLLSLLFVLPLPAQSRREALLEYQARRRQAYTEFRDNYRKACADFMRKRWEAFRAEDPVPVPERREPDIPVMKHPDAPSVPTQDRMPYDKVVDLPEPAPEMPDAPGIAETPVLPGKPAAGKGDGDNGVQQGRKPAAGTDDAAPAVDVSRPFKFTFYGTGCSVSLAAKHRFNLASVQENSVANAWEGVSRGSYDAVAAECVALKKALGLNDWGYYDLVRTLADGFCGPKTNESVVLQSFLMAEAGYKVRMARGDGRLFLLLATDGQVYARPYFNIDGQVFYILDDVPRAASYNICNFTIPGERPLSLAMPAPPLFAQKPAAPAVRNFDGVVSTTVTVNRNLMDFYTNYPPCHWSVYAATALTAPVRGQLYPPLRAAVAGKGEREAAELLLHYLHRAFPYKTDEAQFGVERTLFAEEMYYYPYSDCEDRSILFARLVKDLLGLDVVLLYYPAHIATAVCFKGEVKGDYMQLGNKRYVICDATYIGAGVGEAMPDLKRTPAQVVRID